MLHHHTLIIISGNDIHGGEIVYIPNTVYMGSVNFISCESGAWIPYWFTDPINTVLGHEKAV
jgi:hypothetical protein